MTVLKFLSPIIFLVCSSFISEFAAAGPRKVLTIGSGAEKPSGVAPWTRRLDPFFSSGGGGTSPRSWQNTGIQASNIQSIVPQANSLAVFLKGSSKPSFFARLPNDSSTLTMGNPELYEKYMSNVSYYVDRSGQIVVNRGSKELSAEYHWSEQGELIFAKIKGPRIDLSINRSENRLDIYFQNKDYPGSINSQIYRIEMPEGSQLETFDALVGQKLHLSIKHLDGRIEDVALILPRDSSFIPTKGFQQISSEKAQTAIIPSAVK